MTNTVLTISFDELCQSESLEQEWIIEVIEYGIATPVSGSNMQDWYFDTGSVLWLKKAVRLYHELEIDWVAVGMIIELLKQKELLLEENQSLHNRLQRFHDSDP